MNDETRALRVYGLGHVHTDESPHRRMNVLERFTNKVARKVRGTNVEVGAPLWAVKKGDLYFIWCYTDAAFAQQMDDKLTGPKDEADRAANWRRTLRELTPSDRNSM